MKKRILIAILAVLAFSLLLTGCAPGHERFVGHKPANFLWGIWHGWIAPFSLIVGLFNKSVRIYETVNSGWWYDFDYDMAVISGFGGLSLARGKQKKDEH